MRRLLKPGAKPWILDPTADSWVTGGRDRCSPKFDLAHAKLYRSSEFRSVISGVNCLGNKNILEHERVHIGKK